MFEITRKIILTKFNIYSVNILFNIFGIAFTAAEEEEKLKFIILSMLFSFFRLILEYISLYILYKNIGKTFLNVMDFQVWKYEQIFFIFKKVVLLLDVILSIISSLFCLNIYNKIGYIQKIFLVSYLTKSICFIIYSIIVEPNNIYIIINIDKMTNNAKINLKNIDKLDEDCPICYENNKDKKWAELPCSHKFHNECILEWLKIKNLCPFCRQEFYNLLSS